MLRRRRRNEQREGQGEFPSRATSRPSGRAHRGTRMIGSFPIVAHNQQYIPPSPSCSRSGFQRSVGAVSLPASAPPPANRLSASMRRKGWGVFREGPRGCVRNCARERRRIGGSDCAPLQRSLLSLLYRHGWCAPFIARGATTTGHSSHFRSTSALKSRGSLKGRREKKKNGGEGQEGRGGGEDG